MENSRIEALLNQGISYHQNGQFQEAETCYKEALVLDPDNADAIHLLGLLAEAIGDKDLAIDLIKSAIAIDPTSAVFHNNLANILKFKNEFDLAIACYLEAIKLNPDYAEACFNLANLYRDLDRLEDAVPLYQQATALYPEFAIAHINLAEVLHKLGQLEDAISCYRKYLELKPDDIYGKSRLADALFEFGCAFKNQGLLQKAETSFEEALLVYPTHFTSRNKLALLHHESDESLDDDTSGKRIIVVLGMHRSGTSIITRSLKVFGIDLGNNLMPPRSHMNDKGFWEDLDIVSLNEYMLAYLGTAWDQAVPIADKDVERLVDAGYADQAISLLKGKTFHTAMFGFKDPRTAKLLPFWRKALRQLGCPVSYVLALRNPLSVADSLSKRDGFSTERSYLLWLEHMLVSWLDTKNETRVLVDYDQLMAAPESEIERISKCLALDINPAELSDFLNNFLDHRLRRNNHTLNELLVNQSCPPMVKNVYRLLLEAAYGNSLIAEHELEESGAEWLGKDGLTKASRILLNDASRQIIRLYHLIGERDRQIQELHAKVGDRDKHVLKLDGKIGDQDGQLLELHRKVGDRDKQIDDLGGELAASNQQRDALGKEVLKVNENFRVAAAQVDALTGLIVKGDFNFALESAITMKQSGKFIEALGIVEILIKFQGYTQDTLAFLMELAIALHQQNNFDRAEHIYKQVLEVAPVHVDALHLLGLIYSQRGQYDESMGLIEQSITHSKQPPPHFLKNAGQVAEKVQNLNLAESYYKQAIAADKSYTESYICLIQLYQAQGKTKEARLCRESALKHVPKEKAAFLPTLASVQEKLLGAIASSTNRTTPNSPAVADKPIPEITYVPLLQSPCGPTRFPVKLIAFYLPQFHTIPENDEWWGTGFTEWTNVKPAKPQFKDHYQPHVPGELGYYNLLDPETQQRQVELAKLYGVGGFCFYTYWFSGHLLLEKPVNNYLENHSLDLPFCLCWANENWSRTWDGLDKEVLIAQKHSPEDDLGFIQHVSRFLKDDRYIRIDNKPLLLVYRPSLLPSAGETAERWRQWCRENGIGEIFLAYTQSFEAVDPSIYGFDAAIEFPPNNSAPPDITDTIHSKNSDFSGKIYDWRIFVERSFSYKKPDYLLFRSVCPSWDNTARRKSKGTIFLNSSPVGYQQWFVNAIEETCARLKKPDERVMFVNAWNEWAEGAHLEPDQRYGYAYLEATRMALVRTELQSHQGAAFRNEPLAILIHAFYTEVLDEILIYLNQFRHLRCKLYVTAPSNLAVEVRSKLERGIHDFRLMPLENRGRDTLPMLKMLPEILKEGHEHIVKVHTKKSLHRNDGALWRRELYDYLLVESSLIDALERFRKTPSLGILAPKEHIVPLSYYWGSNASRVTHLANRMGVERDVFMNLSFVAGTMFIAQTSALVPLMNLAIEEKDFEEEAGQIDGTMAHAIERLTGISAYAAGYTLPDGSVTYQFAAASFDNR